MANATQEKPLSKASLSGFEFAVEADEKRNGDILLQSIPGQRLRGALDSSKPIIASPTQNVGEFEPTIPADQAAGLGALPKVPGMQIFVNPAELTYRIFDPLHNNETLCGRLVSALKAKNMAVPGGKINGVKPLEGKLDVDRMKTLCRELRQIVEAGDGKVVPGSGELPTYAEIDSLKGNYLLNPGSRTPSMQPQYEKDFDGWRQRLAQGGG